MWQQDLHASTSYMSTQARVDPVMLLDDPVAALQPVLCALLGWTAVRATRLTGKSQS